MDRLTLWMVALSGLFVSTWCLQPLEIIQSWKTVDFVYPPHETRESMIASGRFIPKHNALIDVDVWEGKGKKKMFVSIPKFSDGSPVTLATVEPDGRLKPYPDWSWHEEGSCQLTSVFRMQVDRCNRLWVLDSAVENIVSNRKLVCKPQLLLFDLTTDELIGRYYFPDNVVDHKSTLVTIDVDTRGENCEDSFAYIADSTSFRLIVFDANRQISWKISSSYFYPYPFHSRFDVSGVQFDIMDGIIGLALGPMIEGDKTLYWHSFSGVRESWVKTSIIRNESLFLNGLNHSPDSFKVSAKKRESPSAPEAMSSNGILFFGLVGSNSIACWNSKLPYGPENIFILEKNNEDLQFPSGIKIKNGKLYVLTDRFQYQMIDKVPKDEVTYRILMADIDKMTAGTPCETHERDNILVQESVHGHSWPPGFTAHFHSSHRQIIKQHQSYDESISTIMENRTPPTHNRKKSDDTTAYFSID